MLSPESHFDSYEVENYEVLSCVVQISYYAVELRVYRPAQNISPREVFFSWKHNQGIIKVSLYKP